ncbi:hypothetical protein FACS1894218_0490 [Bacilli bacterium]|nr:hypothetical protein FACS1894218_0490 [Bacilli bacterium]
MEKYKTFFTKYGILDGPSFDQLVKYTNFKMYLAKDGSKNRLEIIPFATIPVDLMRKLYDGIQKIKHQITVQFIGPILKLDNQEVIDYVKLILQIHGIDNILINNLFSDKDNIEVGESGTIIVKYYSRSETREFNQIKDIFIDFFK